MNRLEFAAHSIIELMPKDEVWVGDVPYFADRFARGGMGFVALLRRNDDRQPRNRSFVHGVDVAIKAFLPASDDPLIGQLFQRELTLWAGLDHPTILKLNEILQTKNDGWVAAMDRCRGSLEDIIAVRQTLPLNDAVFILNDVIQGLAYAVKEHQIFHLDLKPSNILNGFVLSRMSAHKDHPIKQYRWMVSDWGIASVKKATLVRAASSPDLKCRYDTYNNVGTEGYMAPERYKSGVTSSIASDMFSLGLILIKMLSGTLPYTSHHRTIREQVVSGSYIENAMRLLRHVRVPGAITEVALKLIDPQPSRRFQDYEELLLALLKSSRQSRSFLSRLFKS